MKHLVFVTCLCFCSITYAQSGPPKGPSDNASIKAKIRVLGLPLLYTLVFMPSDSAETLGDAGETPDAIIRRCKRHTQSFHNILNLVPIQLAIWRVRLGCISDCVISKGTSYGLPRRIEGGVSDRLDAGEAATMAATLLATVADCSDINTDFGATACDPATQTYEIRLSGSRLITRFDAAVVLMGIAPPLDLPPPPP